MLPFVPSRVPPIAVIGASCRLPGGVDSVGALWQFLREGRDAITVAPENRWGAVALEALEARSGESSHPGPWRGGFLDEDIGAFDAEFFGIGPQAAERMDPQHRLLLEVAWEACEHAGLPAAGLENTHTGVFVGMCNPDYVAYSHWLHAGPGPDFVTGNQFGPAPGRLSHLLGLRGPSLTVDTSCSSGLVAAHLACQSLQVGECDLAFAGAVNLLLSPRVFMAYHDLGVLSPTGRCHSFDVHADGYVRAEGCIVLVLKRLVDVDTVRDRVLAVIAGTAVNHDGRTSRFTKPSARAQEDVFRTALARAGVDPAAVGLIEAHGAGTKVGDPIEFSSLAAVYGAGDGRCALGSAKTNFGHTEAAAGMLGLLKAIVSVEHGEIPASLHFRRWNPEIRADGTRLFVPTEASPWPVTGGDRTAAVCSYGVGGTNAHAIVTEPPRTARPRTEEPTDTLHTFVLSATSILALEKAASRLADWLVGRGSGVALADIAYTLARRRSHRIERLAILARTREELAIRLRAYADGTPLPGIVSDFARGEAHVPLVWVFSGHGSQWPGMGRGLLDKEPAFARAIAALDPLIAAESGFSIDDLLRSSTEVTRVDRVQPMIFAMQIALSETLKARGVNPNAVVGHSMGEVAAAVVAGALGTRDGVRVICRRSRLCVPAAEARTGAMATVDVSHDRARAEIAHLENVDVAGITAPDSTVIGGAIDQVQRLVDEWTARNIPARMIAVDFASHCAMVEPLARALEQSLQDLDPREARLPFYTTVLTNPRAKPPFDAAYWGTNMRDPIRGAGATTALAEDGYRLFQEISPHPVAIRPMVRTLEAAGASEAAVLPCLRAGEDEELALHTSLAALHCAGYAVDWQLRYPNGTLADCPTTTWDRRHYLIDLPSTLAIGGESPTGTDTAAASPESGERAASAAAASSIAAALRSAVTPQARQAVLADYLGGQLRSLLGLRVRRINAATGFSHVGLDSLRALELINRLQRDLDITVSPKLLWAHPSIGALSAYLAEDITCTRPGSGVPSGSRTPSALVAADSIFVDLPAGRFHCFAWGPERSDGAAALLLHANAGSGASWSRVGPALSERFRVFALDLRGHGASVKPPIGGYELRQVAGDVAAFLDALGLVKPFVVGHSWGAAVALVLATGAGSGRAPPVLSGLVLEDPPATFSTAAQDERMAALTNAVGLPAARLREMVEAVNPDWDAVDVESLVEGLRHADASILRSVVHDGARTGALLPLLARLTTPTLLLRADPLCGGLLDDADWARARLLLPACVAALEFRGVPHDIHRSRFTDFIDAIRGFLLAVDSHEAVPARMAGT